MNRKQKIIVSVTGIFLVALILIGLTYAYFLTQIKGNTNNKSISVTTANLVLTYGDGNGILEVGDKLRPGNSVNFKTASGTTVNEKTFTVTNSGDDSSYVVIVDNVNVAPEPFESNDFRYTLTCTSSDDNKCDGTTDSIFYLKNQSILVGNEIAAGVTHTYTLTMEYKETGKNQSNDMGKSFTARINIEDIRRLDNPYKDNTNSLAYHIINNSVNATNGTQLINAPLTNVAEETSRYFTNVYKRKTAYYPSWEEGGYDWENLSYGDTQGKADGYYNEIPSFMDPVKACNSVIGQYISDVWNCYYDGCDSIGKVVGCESDGTPILEENDNYPSWEDGGYEWPGLTYGDTLDIANGEFEPNEIASGVEAVEACNSVKGQYISDYYYCNYDGCDSIGKVVDCEDDGTPVIDNQYEYEEPIYANDTIISVTSDDYGISYYYRGDVEDNYVNFAEMCWRIVRVNGDGSTKLILEDQDQSCSTNIDGNWAIPTTTGGTTYTGNYGFTRHPNDTLTASDGTKNSYSRDLMDYLHGQTNGDRSMATAFKNFQNTFTKDETEKLKVGDWCLADNGYSRTGSSSSDYTYTLLNETQIMDNKIKNSTFYYDSYVRLSGDNKDGFKPTLKCNGTIMDDWEDSKMNPTSMYVGAITADEMVYAGGSSISSNKNYYLVNEEFKKGEEGANKSYFFWSFSPILFAGSSDRVYSLYESGKFYDSSDVSSANRGAFRPSIQLKAGVEILSGGNGTKDNPYVIK